MTYFTARDCKEIGFCVDGQKKFCDRYGLDFRTFLREGVDSDTLKDLNDANLTRVIEHVRAKKEKGQHDG